MAGYQSIKSLSETAKAAKSAVSGKKNTFDRKASSVSGNWRGEAGEGFKDAYQRLRNRSSSLVTNYGTLSSKLNSLSNSVKRAEG